MNTIYLVRHGETEWNKTGKYQGSTDMPLSAVGRAQAACCAEALKNVKFDKIIASNLSRALVTAQTIAAKHNMPVEVDARLQEIHFGQWESLTYDEIDARWPGEVMKMYRQPAQITIAGGESFKDLQVRSWAAVKDALSTMADGETLLVVCHGGTIRTLFCEILNLPLNNAWNFAQGNTAINRIYYYGEGSENHNVLNLSNDLHHLELMK